MEKEKWLTAEMGGHRRRLPMSKLKEAKAMSKEMSEIAGKAGFSEEEIQKYFSIQIIEEDI